MQTQVSGETPFQAIKNCFTVGPSTDGYTLMFGVEKDITKMTAYKEATPANETLIVNGVTPYTWFALSGNTGSVKIIA